MSEQQPNTQPPPPTAERRWMEPGHDNALLIYTLFFLSMALGITALIGVIMAYLNRGKTADYVESHYTWLIRTFWIGLLAGLVSFVLTFILIGFVLMLLVAVWVIMRLIVGLQALARREAIPDPTSWWI